MQLTNTAFTNANPETNQIILHDLKIQVDHVCGGMQIDICFLQAAKIRPSQTLFAYIRTLQIETVCVNLCDIPYIVCAKPCMNSPVCKTID